MSDTATFKTQIEIVTSEPVKFDGGDTFHKHEAYLHDSEKKYPTATDIYNREKLETGFYNVDAEMYISKGKVAIRKTFVKAQENKGFQTPAEKKAA